MRFLRHRILPGCMYMASTRCDARARVGWGEARTPAFRNVAKLGFALLTASLRELVTSMGSDSIDPGMAWCSRVG